LCIGPSADSDFPSAREGLAEKTLLKTRNGTVRWRGGPNIVPERARPRRMASITSSRVPLGTILEGKFRINREIGRGGMAAVYEAENIDIGKRVAVKILAAELITSRIVRERFLREARAAAAIRSPYICDVYDSGMYDDRPFLVMELLEGESLYDMMMRVRKIDVESTLRIATHTARALARAHESSVVHRDLKPENIFLTKDEEGQLLAKIVDFGLAKFYEQTGADAVSARITREGALFGTPAYMSPEQAKGQGEVDHRADLWALGCIVYECLTGHTVWNIEQGVAMILAQIAGSPLPRPSALRPDLPPSFDAWFARALDRDPSHRYQSARELADTLADALAGKAPETKSETAFRHETGAAIEAILAEETTRTDPERTSSAPDARAPSAISVEPKPRAAGSRAISLLLLGATLALGAYAIWLYVLHPPGKRSGAATLPALQSAAVTPSVRRESRPPRSITAEENEPYALKLGEAQELFTKDAKKSLDLFQSAFRQGSMPAARSLLSHATVAVDESQAGCRVTGIARPRPFQLEGPASRPTIAYTPKGSVVSWVDNHLDQRERQAFTVLLDSAMRRKSVPVPVTPESHNVRQPQLLAVKNGLVLVFWDEGGKEPGVYARLLDAEGKIQSPPYKLSASRKSAYPALAAAPDGELWAVWEEEFDGSGSDIVARRLGPELEPRSETVRLTKLHQPRTASQPRTPDVTVSDGKLHVVFAKDLGNQRLQVMLQSIALDDPKLAQGLVPASAKAKQRSKEPRDEFVGTLRPVSTPSSKNAEPHLACTGEGCFVAWDDEKAGAVAAYVDREKGPLWHREFSRKGSRPTVSHDERSAVVAWFEDSRLRFATLGRDGVGKPSTLSRVSGFQPNPDLARGEKPGQWYIAFRDYESAHLEAFALRAECR
jgi:serine/threonine-protein kinase